MSEDTTVNIKGTFSVKHREHNGLNRVADLINGDRLVRVPIVGYVVFHKHVETVQGDQLTVSLEAVEPCIEPDGSDPAGIGRDTMAMLDRLRKAAGKGNVADTLFVNGPSPELDGQLEAITRGDSGATEVMVSAGSGASRGAELADVEDEGRAGSPHESSDPEQVVNASGDPVPEKSGEEIMAERAEAAADAGRQPEVTGAAPEGAVGMVERADRAASALAGLKPARAPRGDRKRPPAASFTPPAAS